MNANPPNESELNELFGALVLDAVQGSRRGTDSVELGRALEQTYTSPPPDELRATIGAVAQRMPRQRPVGVSPVDTYRRQVEALVTLVSSLSDADWSRQALPYQWSIHGVMAHLLVVERYFQNVVGPVRHPWPSNTDDHLAMGADEIEAELHKSPTETVASWRDAVETSKAMFENADLDLDRVVRFHIFPFSVSSLLIARAFEIWTHADDIRRAIGRPLAAPSPEELVTMSSVSVASLPLAARVLPGAVPNGRARVVLIGQGGATYDLILGTGGDHLVTVVADIVDYCRIAAKRLDSNTPGVVEIEGDAIVANRLLQASSIASA